AASLEALASHGSLMRPAAQAVAIVQDRIQEKAFLKSSGVPVAPYQPGREAGAIQNAPADLVPRILKAARLGYDGKGQARVGSREEARRAFQEFGGHPCVLEALLAPDHERSVVLARRVARVTVFNPTAVN